MRKIQVSSGEVYGRLTILYEPNRYIFPDGKRVRMVYCKCSCGKEALLRLHQVVGGRTKSCGCAWHLGARLTHGHHRKGFTSKTYRAWAALKKRCKNKNEKEWHRYGGRGISFDPRWESFENFLEDMGICPEGMSIDRIDNDGDYCKKNCRWTTPKIQANNRSSNRLVTYDGITRNLSEWANELGMTVSKLHARLEKFDTPGEAFNAPTKKQCIGDECLITYNGASRTIAEWEKATGIHQSTIRCRLDRGWPLEDALTKKPTQRKKQSVY